MGLKDSKLIVGIAYHSPLDVITLLPTNVKVTMKPSEKADVFITDKVVREFGSRVQLVFSSTRNLYKENISILDQGSWGKVVTLTSTQMETVVIKGEIYGEAGVPDWIRF